MNIENNRAHCAIFYTKLMKGGVANGNEFDGGTTEGCH